MMPKGSGEKGRFPSAPRPKIGTRQRWSSGRPESTLTIMDRLFANRVSVTMSGQPKQVSVVEAIVLQLLQKAMSKNSRAWRTLSKYQEFARRHSDKPVELIFTESDYTNALAAFPSNNGDG
jgi:Family of unknown function (DUF5681)